MYPKYKYSFLVIVLLFSMSLSFGQSGKFKVALDAGHGGKDPGSAYHSHVEKEIALAVVLKVGKILEKNGAIDVVYTRKTDVFIDLVERANIANRANAHIFVSIHCNANKNTAADGTETYVMGMAKNASNLEAAKRENAVITMEKDYKEKYEGFDPSSPEAMIGITLMQEEYMDNSIALATKVQDRFVDLGKKSRGGGVKQAPYMVLHKAYMPRVLIEMGFISNPKEGAELDSEAGQNDIAQAIANAIISYKREYFGSGANDIEVKPSQRIVETSPSQPKEPSKEKVSEPSTGIIFKVQISASAKKLNLVSSNFRGLKNISVTTDNGSLYKYMYGETSDYEVAKENLAEAKSKGFDTAYLVAFKDGKKITVQEALK